MKLTDMTLTAFTDVLASEAPAPGGGSTAALAGSLGAALTAMVCALTCGKKKYAEYALRVGRVQKRALDLQKALIDAVDSDTRAFKLLNAAYQLPKETTEEKATRSEAIQRGLISCIESPLHIMELIAEGLTLVEELAQGFNNSTASDLGVSVLMLKSALLGAWLNVRINLGGLEDAGIVETYKNCGQTLLDYSLSLADELYAKIDGLL